MSKHPEYISMARRGGMLYPVDERSREAMRRLPQDEAVGVRIMRDRSLPFHNRFWAMLSEVAKATAWETPERLLVALKLRLGRYDLMQLRQGKTVPVPHSISFGEMSDTEFRRFAEEATEVICAEVLPGYNPDDLYVDQEVARNVVPFERHAKAEVRRMLNDSLVVDADDRAQPDNHHAPHR